MYEIIRNVCEGEATRRDLLPDRAPVHRSRDSEIERRDDVAPENSGEIVDHRERRDHYESGKHARCNQLLDRVRAESVERIYLLCNAHRSKLRGDSRSNAPRNHQSRQDGTELSYHRAGHETPDVHGSAERPELNGGLERENHPGEKTGEKHNAERAHANGIHLLDEITAIERPGEDESDRLSCQNEIFLERKHLDRKSTRLNSSHGYISYAVFCLK